MNAIETAESAIRQASPGERAAMLAHWIEDLTHIWLGIESRPERLRGRGSDRPYSHPGMVVGTGSRTGQ